MKIIFGFKLKRLQDLKFKLRNKTTRCLCTALDISIDNKGFFVFACLINSMICG